MYHSKKNKASLHDIIEGDQKNTWKRDLKKEMWTAGFMYSWRKMEAAVQNRAGLMSIVYACGLCSTGSDNGIKSSQVSNSY